MLQTEDWIDRIYCLSPYSSCFYKDYNNYKGVPGFASVGSTPLDTPEEPATMIARRVQRMMRRANKQQMRRSLSAFPDDVEAESDFDMESHLTPPDGTCRRESDANTICDPEFGG